MKKSKIKQELEDFNSALSALAAKVKVLEETTQVIHASNNLFKTSFLENKLTIKNDDPVYGVDKTSIKIPKQQLEVGKWYKQNDLYPQLKQCLVCITESGNLGASGYGICDGVWFNVDNTFYNDAIPATHQEVEEALINEAKRRGFKIGAKIKYEDHIANIIGDLYFSEISKCIAAMTDTQTRGNEYFPIMTGGKWSEIVEETKEIDWSVPGILYKNEDLGTIILSIESTKRSFGMAGVILYPGKCIDPIGYVSHDFDTFSLKVFDDALTLSNEPI